MWITQVIVKTIIFFNKSDVNILILAYLQDSNEMNSELIAKIRIKIA